MRKYTAQERPLGEGHIFRNHQGLWGYRDDQRLLVLLETNAEIETWEACEDIDMMWYTSDEMECLTMLDVDAGNTDRLPAVPPPLRKSA